MAVILNENLQYIDGDTGAPLLAGKIFYGEAGTDPIAAPIQVFLDPALETVVLQPVRTDSDGRTIPTPLFIQDRYSLLVRDSQDNQKLINLNAGSSTVVGITRLTNIGGTGNAITAQADPPISSLGAADNGRQFTLTAPSINTDKMTLDIDTVGPLPIKFNFNEEMGPRFVQANSTLNLTYNSTGNNFTWNNEGRGISILTNVQGDGNAITADGGPSITGLVNGQHYQITPNITNTGDVTLTVKPDGIASLPTLSVKSKGNELVAGQFVVGKTAEVIFNSTPNPDEFELSSGSGNAVAPASATDGNVVKFGANPNQLVDSLVSSLGPLSIQSIAGTGTWTRPANVKSVLVILTGSGGGGSGSSTSDAGGGGGAGTTVIKFIAAAASSYAVVIGAAGTGGAGGNGAGGDGADSTVGGTVVVAQKGFGAPATQAGGNGGSTGTGDHIIAGASGNAVDDSTTQLGGEGGGSYWGGGGSPTREATGGAGLAFGTGGAGGPTGGNFGGGAAKTGVAFFLEFG